MTESKPMSAVRLLLIELIEHDVLPDDLKPDILLYLLGRLEAIEAEGWRFTPPDGASPGEIYVVSSPENDSVLFVALTYDAAYQRVVAEARETLQRSGEDENAQLAIAITEDADPDITRIHIRTSEDVAEGSLGISLVTIQRVDCPAYACATTSLPPE